VKTQGAQNEVRISDDVCSGDWELVSAQLLLKGVRKAHGYTGTWIYWNKIFADGWLLLVLEARGRMKNSLMRLRKPD
jgi:hypothetical protein